MRRMVEKIIAQYGTDMRLTSGTETKTVRAFFRAVNAKSWQSMESEATLLGEISRGQYAYIGVIGSRAKTASVNDWSAVIWAGGEFYQSRTRENLEIYDRVGGGDGFASGLAYGFLEGLGPQMAVEYGAAHGALAMTTPGDTTMATLAEVKRLAGGGNARVQR